eukprot:s588_g7.t1
MRWATGSWRCSWAARRSKWRPARSTAARGWWMVVSNAGEPTARARPCPRSDGSPLAPCPGRWERPWWLSCCPEKL